MKLVVCGCSWSSRDRHYPDTEFGYFVSQHYGWEYENIGLVGCSNHGIRMQIEYAVKEAKADFVIVNWTTACRDIITSPKATNKFDFSKGLKNLSYHVDHLTDDTWHPQYPDIDTTIISQSIPGLVYLENPQASWEEVNQFWPEVVLYFNEAQFNAYRKNFLYNYNSEVQAMNQYFIMQSAVQLFETHNVKYFMSPNTFKWKQAYHDMNNLTFDDDVWMHEYTFDFVPEINLENNGIANALQWDLELMDDPINYPNHNHCHHLSVNAQKRWATEVAIPRIDKILEVDVKT